jgi:transcriptional regulator with XRE-family HTH domain
MEDVPTFDGRQITAARALAELTVAELASLAGVTVRTVHRLEIGGPITVSPGRRHGSVSRDVWDRITNALRVAGVELLPEIAGAGSGVRWYRPRSERDL